MDSKRVFSPPDIDSDPSLGVKSLVVEMQKSEFKFDEKKHKQSKFCKNFRLEEPLADFIGRLNSTVSPFKKVQLSSERNSFLFLIVGLLITSLLFFLAIKFVNLTAALIIFLLYLISLAFFLWRNSKRATVMQ
jgi:Flp pilus assembly protein TadB